MTGEAAPGGATIDPNRDPILAQAPTLEGYKTVGPCVLYSRLGAGGMGTVYRGQHLKLEIEVAVKVLRSELARREEFVERFSREARVAARLNSPHLVRVFDIDHEGSLHFVIMEYVDGETARERAIRKGPLSEEEALEIVLGAARGLAAAHQGEVLHRDIKPDNILIDCEGMVKLADLGLAKAMDEERDSSQFTTTVGAVVGTPAFMSPEQCRDLRAAGPASDVYSLGTTLFYLLVGNPPFQASSDFGTMLKICSEDLPKLADQRHGISENTIELLQRMTARSLDTRIANGTDLVEAILAYYTPRAEKLADAHSGELRLHEAQVSPPPPPGTVARIRKHLSEARTPIPGSGAHRSGALPGSGSHATVITPVPGSPSRFDSSATRTARADRSGSQSLGSQGPAEAAAAPSHGKLKAVLVVVLLAVAGVVAWPYLSPEDSTPPAKPTPDVARGVNFAQQLNELETQFEEQSASKQELDDSTLESLRESLAALPAEAHTDERYSNLKSQLEQFESTLQHSKQQQALLADARSAYDAGQLNSAETLAQQARAFEVTKGHAAADTLLTLVSRAKMRRPLELDRDRADQARDAGRHNEAETLYRKLLEDYDKLVAAEAEGGLEVEASRWKRELETIVKRRQYNDARATAKAVTDPKARLEQLRQLLELAPDEATRKECQDEIARLATHLQFLALLDRADKAEETRQAARLFQEAAQNVATSDERELLAQRQSNRFATALAAASQVLEDNPQLATQLFHAAGALALDDTQRASCQEGLARAQQLLTPKDPKPDDGSGNDSDPNRDVGSTPSPTPGSDSSDGSTDGSTSGGDTDHGAPRAWQIQLPKGQSLELFELPAGSFTMGSPTSEEGRSIEELEHAVRLRAFSIGRTEVTEAQFHAVMPGVANAEELLPKTKVSLRDARRFCVELTELLGEQLGGRFQLPTEAQWEYAARAGNEQPYPWQRESDAHEFANLRDQSFADSKGVDPTFAGNDGFAAIATVGQFKANAWGLHDTLGNVWEWVEDFYQEDYYDTSPAQDPTGPEGPYGPGLARGGAANTASAGHCRYAFRGARYTKAGDQWTGFRVAFVANTTQ